LKKIFAHPAARALLALLLVWVLGMIFNADGAFFKWGTHRATLRQMSTYGILACGMTVVIITAGIDLAVGSILALSAVVFAKLSIHLDWPAAGAIAAAVVAATACGVVSGGLTARFGVQPFIATLAMMVFARGMAKCVSGGEKVSTAVQDANGSYSYKAAPHIMDFLNSWVLGNNLAVVTILFAVAALTTWVLLARSRWGRYLYAIGGNEEAARLSAVPVARMKLLAYGYSGLLAGVAGLCQAAQEMQGDPEAGVAYELTAIAMVVIGGTSLMGGRGGVGLTILGALTISYLEKILSINNVAEANRLMLTGAIIVGAVLFQRSQKSV
jgi:ribose transport system permease protein